MKKKKSWDNKWYTEEFLSELKNTEYQKTDGNLKYRIKYPPDAESEFGIDPRMLGGPIGKMAKGLQFIPDILFDNLHMKISRYSLELFRKGCAKISYADCHINNIEIKNTRIPASDGYQIPVRIYQNDKCNMTKVLLVFIHGGAFVGGTLEPYDESLKMFVDKFNIEVLSIDYRLLPENLYPIPYTDCFDVIEHIYENSDTYNIDKNKIFVCGDSAGGNIAQACSTKFKNTNVIRGQLLLYPTLNIFGYEDKYYKKGFDDYEFEPSQKRLSKSVIRQMQMLTNCNIKQIGIKSPDAFNSPYLYSASGNPPTFISAGALDYLKKDAIAWAHKLVGNNVDVNLVIYNGLGHGYLNATGVFPQSEDLIEEMGSFINSVLNK